MKRYRAALVRGVANEAYTLDHTVRFGAIDRSAAVFRIGRFISDKLGIGNYIVVLRYV